MGSFIVEKYGGYCIRHGVYYDNMIRKNRECAAGVLGHWVIMIT